MPKTVRILYCHCSNTELVPAEAKAAVLEALAAAGAELEAVPDLCELAARGDPALARLAQAGPLRIIACYPRTIRWLFAAAGTPLPEKGIEILNLRADGAKKIVAKIKTRKAAAKKGKKPIAAALLKDLDASARQLGEWIPWFPVIDRSRCKNCKQCLNFCLFGVYENAADGSVRVAHPENCKTGCPACARVCPHLAIIFPKHEGGPVNGAEVAEGDLARDDMRVGLEAHSRADILAALRERNKALASGDASK